MKVNRENRPITNGAGFLGSPYSVFLVVFVVGMFYVLTLHEGHNWGDDFAQYIHHAKNLAEGKHYLDTGFISNSLASFVGPYAYSPVFPALLTPVYWVYGLNLEALKLVGIACFCLTLMLLPGIFGYQLNRLQQISIIVLTGFNPALWEARNHILTDFTFILFCYLSLLLMLAVFHSDCRQRRDTRQALVSSFLIGIAMYLAYGSREIGIILPFVVLTYEIICTRRISLISTTSITIFLVLFLLQHLLLRGNFTSPEIQNNLKELAIISGRLVTVSHLDFISIEPASIAERIKGYRWVFGGFWRLWPPSDNQVLGMSISLISVSTAVMTIIGFFLALTRKITVLEIFFIGYIAVLLLFGAPPTLRYLFPLFPLVLFYCILAYQWIFSSNRFHLRTTVLASYFSLTVILYGYAIYNHYHGDVGNRVPHPNSYAAITNGVTHPKAVEMFEFIRRNTAQSDTIVSRKPRLMALLTQRKSAGVLDRVRSAEFINSYFDAIEADYYVEDNLGSPLTDSEPPTPRFLEVFRNTHFVIYEYHGV